MNEDRAADRTSRLIEDVRPQWVAWLRRRYRGLEAQHEDIVQEAVTGLWQYIERNKSSELPDDELRRIGFAIVRRRVADAFRGRVRAWSTSEDLDQVTDASGGADVSRVQEFGALLRAVLACIADLDKESRALLVRNQEEHGGQALSDAERQRLSRLRAGLRKELAERFGIDVRQLLKD